MSSRKEQKERARAERLAREQAAAGAERRRRRIQLGTAVATAAVALFALVAISQSSTNSKSPAGGAAGAAKVNAMFRGIPQHGLALGNPAAPVTLTEFADLQCPFCAEFATGVLPEIVDRYVRDGRVRIVFRNLTFLGPDSERAALAASVAARRNRLWQFAELFYRSQGPERSGYVTDGFLRKIARGVRLDPEPVVGRANEGGQEPSVAAAAAEAERLGVSSTPSFLIGRRGQQPHKLDLPSASAGELATAIDRELSRR